jgi:hypothetical protein
MTKYQLIINQVKEVLSMFNPDAQSVINESDAITFYFDHQIDNTTIEVYVNIFEEFEYYRLAIHLPFIVPENKRQEIAQFLFDQNEFLSYATFLFSFDTGRIILKSDMQFQNIDFENISDCFSDNLNDCFNLLNETYPAMMQLIYNLSSIKKVLFDLYQIHQIL